MGVDGDTPYIVMELLEGESLSDRLTRVGRLSAAQTELVLRHVSRAVARAHELGIVHRDLKPANIFITRNEEEEIIKIFDFGIAKTAEGDDDLSQRTRTGSLLGTPSYMSPEQLEGKRCDHRADIWAMGVISYECLLGQLPFTGSGLGGLVLRPGSNNRQAARTLPV
jgi:serine/threonine protein kinase